MKTINFQKAILFLIVVLMSNCQKEVELECLGECLVFQGQVTDAYSGEPIKDVNFTLRSPSNSFVYLSLPKVAEGTTNKDGDYRIIINREDISTLRGDWEIEFYQNNYLDTGDELEIEFENIDTTDFNIARIGNIKLTPKATVLANVRMNSRSNSSVSLVADYEGATPLRVTIPGPIEIGTHEYKIDIPGDRYTLLKFIRGGMTVRRDSIFIESWGEKKVNIESF